MESKSNIEKFTIGDLACYLKRKDVDDSTIKTIEEAGIDGKIFLSLHEADIKDLLSGFLERKKIRDIIRELNEEENYNTPMKKPKQEDVKGLSIPTTPKIVVIDNVDEPQIQAVCVSYSHTLDSPDQYSENEVGRERTRVIRQAMDTLVNTCKGRPSEMELLNLAKSIAAKYPILRDSQDGGLRDNYNGLKGFLRRRMYNTTPAVTKRGRKKKDKSSVTIEDKEPKSPSLELPEDVKEKEQKDDRPKKNMAEDKDSSEKKDAEKAVSKNILDDPVAALESKSQKELKDLILKCAEKTQEEKVIQLLRLTMESMISEFEAVPIRSKIDTLMDRYKVFKNSKMVLEYLCLVLPRPISVQKMRDNAKYTLEGVLDFVFSKGLLQIPKSSLSTEDQRMTVALAHLPKVVHVKGSQRSEKTLKASQLLVHIVKKDEALVEASSLHRNLPQPYVIHNRLGEKVVIVVMVRDKVLYKAESMVDAILMVMGLYYCCSMPYPTSLNAAMLYIQKEVLEDDIHSKDMDVLQKGIKELSEFLKGSTNDFENLFE